METRRSPDLLLQDTGPAAGQALLEFIVILPILLLLLVGMVETVALANDYLRLQAVVREGARFGSYRVVAANAEGAAQVRELVLSQMAAKGMVVADPANDILVIFADMAEGGGGRIQRVQYPAASARCPSELTADELLARARAQSGPLDTSLVAVEVCWGHPQLLGLPLIGDLLPNPVPLQLQAVMPRPLD
jgi:hypothetical protein